MWAAMTFTVTDAMLNKSRYAGQISDILVSQAQAETGKIARISAPDQIAENWSPDTLFYVQWDVPISDSVMMSLQKEFQQKYPDTQYTFFFTWENPSKFRYTNRKWKELRWKDAIDWALGEELVSQTSLGIWKKHIVLWISFKKDNNDERWVRPLTSSEFDELGIGEQSNFAHARGPLFSRIFPQLKSGNFGQAIQIFVEWYEEKFQEKVEDQRRAAELQAQQLQEAKSGLSQVEASLNSLTVSYRSFLWKTPPAWWDRDIENSIQEAQSHIHNENGSSASHNLSSAQSSIDYLLNLIENHESFWEKIEIIRKHIQKASESPYADQAEREKQTVNQLVDRLESEWKAKDVLSYGNTYSEALNAFEDYVDEINQAKITAETAERNEAVLKTVGTWWAWLWIIGSIIAGWRLNRRRKPTKEQFETEIKKWRGIISQAQEKLMTDIIPKTDMIVELLEDSQNTTKKKVEQLGNDVGTLSIVLAKLMQTLRDIETEVWSHFFRKWPYETGLKMLQNTEIQIDPVLDAQDEDLLAVTTWEDITTLRWLADKMTFTFEDMVSEADTRLVRITETFQELEEANSQYEISSQQTGVVLQMLLGAVSKLSTHTGRDEDVIFPHLGRFQTRFQKRVEEIDTMSMHDKIGAYNQLMLLSEKMLILQEWIEWINMFISEHAPVASRNLLVANGYSVDWVTNIIEPSFKKFAENKSKVLSQKVDVETFSADIEASETIIMNIYTSIISIKDIGRKFSEQKEVVNGVKSTLQALGEELSETYNINQEQLFQEEWFNPEDCFSAITDLSERIVTAINSWDVESGESMLQKMSDEVQKIREIMSLTQTAFSSYDENKSLAEAGLNNISDILPGTKSALTDIQSSWSESVQRLWAGDPTHPNSDGYIWNNIDEIYDNQGISNGLIKDSQVHIDDGKPITAQDQLARSRSLSEDSLYKTQEVHSKKESIETTDKENTKLVSQILAEIEILKQEQSNPDILSSTLESVDGIVVGEEYISSVQKKQKRDPFDIQVNLQKFMEKVDNTKGQIAQDKKAKRDLDEHLATIQSQLSRLASEGTNAQYDDYPDSESAQQVFEVNIPTYEDRYATLFGGSETPNSNWYEILKTSNSLEEDILGARKILSQDEKNRQVVEESMRVARSRIQDARDWDVTHGISITGSIGSSSLNQAEQYYIEGDFHTASEYASSAYKKANTAVENAERKLRRKLRKIAEEEERQRRLKAKKKREAAARAAESSSDSSWFGWGGSFGWGSSWFGWGGSW